MVCGWWVGTGFFLYRSILRLVYEMRGFVFVCSNARKIEVRAFGILVACFSMELGILTNLEVFLLARFF